MRPRPHTLRFRLTAAFVAMAVVPAGILGGYELLTLPGEAAERVAAGDRLAAEAVAGQVDRFLEAQLVHVRELALGLDRAGAGGVAEHPGAHLALHMAANPALHTLLVLDRTGRVERAVPDRPDLRRIDLSAQPWWRLAMERGQPSWSSATTSLETGQPTVTLVVPARDAAVVAFLDLQVLQRVVGQGGHRAHDATVAVLDDTGTFIAHPDERLVREHVNVGDVGAVRQALQGALLTEESDLLGRRSLLSATRVPQSGWVVLVAHPVEAALAARAEVRNALLLVLLAAAAAAVLGGVAFSRQLARPIEALVERTGIVASGQAPAPLVDGGVRETRALAAAFELMADAVRAREDALARSERAYRQLIDAPLVAVFRAHAGGRVEFANRGLALLVGAPSPGALIGADVREICDEPERWEELVAGLRRSGRTERLDCRVRRLDGTAAVALANFALDGDLVSGVLMDVTSLRRAGEERARLEEQLRHAQRLDAVGRLAGGVAHDFNNLLTAITGFATVLRDGLPADHAEHESVDAILQCSERAARLTRSLLAYSRKQVLHPVPMDLREAVRSVARLAGRVLGEDVTLAVRLGDDRLTVVADEGQLEQVLLNLCTNARDAMPRGGRLTIAAEEVELGEAAACAEGLDRGGRYARLTVTDTGEGMRAEVVERVFEPFFTTKPPGLGTGLGLSIVYGIVRQHDGAVRVQSAPGAGATFTILLPMPAAAGAQPPAAGPEEAPPGGSETLLVAEDEALVRKVIRTALERAGYRILEAADGAEAVEVFRRSGDRVALCLLDVVMPRLNGKEALEAIRRLDPEIRAVFLSGYAGDVLTARGVDEVGATLLQKPIAPADLLREVRAALDARARTAA